MTKRSPVETEYENFKALLQQLGCVAVLAGTRNLNA